MENKNRKEMVALESLISEQIESAYQEFLNRFVDFENGEDIEGYFVERKVDDEVGIRNSFPYSESSVLNLVKVLEKIRDLHVSYQELTRMRKLTVSENFKLRALNEIRGFIKEGGEWTEEREVALFKMFRDGFIS